MNIGKEEHERKSHRSAPKKRKTTGTTKWSEGTKVKGHSQQEKRPVKSVSRGKNPNLLCREGTKGDTAKINVFRRGSK